MDDAYSIVADMVREAEKHSEYMASDRIRALEYYNGVMKDTPSEEKRSGLTTRDVRANIKKVMPSIMRTMFGGAEVVEYHPTGPEDEESSQQATDYINSVVVPEAGVRGCLYDAIFDALRTRNGILKWWWDERTEVSVSRHTGLSEDAFAVLVGEDDVEVLEHTEREEMSDLGPALVHDLKIRRTVKRGRVMAAAVPAERFIIHPDAISLTDSLLVGDRCELRRSDLIAMGYDKDVVMALPLAGEDDEEIDRRGFDADHGEAQRVNDPVDYYEIYVRVDMDGDGISELRRMCFGGRPCEKTLLADDDWDEVQICDIKVQRLPHQWEGISLADDLMDIQRGKTVLLRQTLDNLYWQNNPQPIFQGGAVVNPEAVYEPEFGLPIELKEGRSAAEAIGFNRVPFVATNSFAMMEYLDAEAQDRTGVSDASGGLPPDALQNMTATASAMIEQAGIGQSEMMVRTIAECAAPFFKGILRLTIKHQDRPRMVKLRGEWVEFDPRQWNAEMDATVSTGLGAGTRERDMAMLQGVMGWQEKLLAAFGPNNPFVKPENIWNALSRLVDASGLKRAEMYFTEPDQEEVAALLEGLTNKPDPEMAKVEAQREIEMAKAQSAQAKERAQMDADLVVERARIEAETERQRNDLAAKTALQERQIAWEREKFAMEMAARQSESSERRQDEIWKAQAAGIRLGGQ